MQTRTGRICSCKLKSCDDCTAKTSAYSLSIKEYINEINTNNMRTVYFNSKE